MKRLTDEALLITARYLGIEAAGMDRKALRRLVDKVQATRIGISNPNAQEYGQLTDIAQRLGLDTPYGERMADRKHRIETCLAAHFCASGIQDSIFIRYTEAAPQWAGAEVMLWSTVITWFGGTPYIVLLQGPPISLHYRPALEVVYYMEAVV